MSDFTSSSCRRFDEQFLSHLETIDHNLHACFLATAPDAATSARLVCPKMYAHATAATALMSVKVLFKQPPWLYGLARAVNGKKE